MFMQIMSLNRESRHSSMPAGRHLVIVPAAVTALVLELLGVIGVVGVILFSAPVLLVIQVAGVFFGLVMSTLFVDQIHA